MGLSIDGLGSYSAYQGLLSSQNDLAKTMADVASGSTLRNGNNPSGLSIDSIMNAQASGLNVASANAQNGISLLQTAGSALGHTTDILQQIRSVAVQAANGTQDQASLFALGNQVTQSLAQLDQISASTTFGGANLLDGSQAGGISFQVGSTNSPGSSTSISIPSSASAALGLTGLDSLIAGGGNVSNALTAIDTAISNVSSTQSDIGATTSALSSSIDDISSEMQNLQEASSSIGGTDIAQASMKMSADKIQSQFAISLMAQANGINRDNATQLLKSL